MEHSSTTPGGGPVSRRRVIATLVASFTVIMTGLAVIDAVVLRTLRPQLLELSSISDDHARALSGANQLRERLASLRRRIAASVDRPRAPFTAGPAFASVDETVAHLERVCDTDVERVALARVRDALGRSRTIAALVEQAMAAHDGAQARRALDDYADAAGDAVRAADEIVGYNAREVRNAAQRVHASLYRAMIATSALAVAILIAALVLLRAAVRAVSSYAAVLERHAEDMAAFAARAAHELRSPLQTLSLSVGALRAQVGPSPTLERAESSTRRLASTLKDILDFSVSGGRVDPADRCAVATVVAEVEQELVGRAGEAGLTLTAEADATLEILMASGHLRTVLSNLVGNAIKYAARPEGGRVSMTARCEGGRAVIAVSDDGPGIPMAALAHVFEPFYRATTRRDGYGLGLATVRRLVEAHDGHVRVESAPGSGTTFVVDLPRAQAVPEGPRTAAASSAARP